MILFNFASKIIEGNEMFLIYNDISALSETELFVLCGIAYGKNCATKDYIFRICSWKGISKKEYSKALSTLTKLRAIGYSYDYWDTYHYVTRNWFVYAMKKLVCEKSEWIKIYQSVDKRKHYFTPTDCDVIAKGEKLSASLSHELMDFLVPAAFDSTLSGLVDGLSDYDFPEFFHNAIEWALQADCADTENQLPKLLDRRRKAMSVNDFSLLAEHLSLYRYYAFGEYKPYGTSTHYGILLNAIRLLHKGNADESLERIKEALKLKNKTSNVKNMFDCVLDNYFLAAAYSHLAPDEAKKKTEMLLKKKPFLEPDQAPGQMAAEIVLRDTHEVSTTSIMGLLNFGRYSGRKLYKVFADHYAVRQDFPIPEKDNYDHDIQLSILKHEFQQTLNLDPAECERLNSLYGAPVFLEKVIVPQWEIDLNELANFFSDKKEGGGKAQPTSRLAYFIHGSYIDVKEQTILKNGRWSVGKDVNYSRYYDEKGDCMDERDHKIYAAFNGETYYMTVKTLMPFLIGCDRVFTGRYSPYYPVTVTEEMPYVIVDKRNGKFVISSNVTFSGTEPNLVVKKDDTSYGVIKLSPTETAFYQRLLKLGSLPLKSEELLRKVLPLIANKVELHSPLMEGEDSLETVSGSPVVVLQITPNNDYTFYAKVLAAPLAGGKQRFDPGKGPSIIIDEADGKRYQVKRSLKAEKENYKALDAFIDDLHRNFVVDNPQDNVYTLSQYGLLSAMEFIAQNADKMAVEWPDGEKLRLKSVEGNWDVNVKESGGWFEVEGEVTLDSNTTMNMATLLKLVGNASGQRFIRLSDTEFVTITDKLRKQLERIEAISVSNNDKVMVPRVSASLLGEAVHGTLSMSDHDNAISNLCQSIEKSYTMKVAVPRTLKATLRDYQEDGFRWMARLDSWGAGACLADDMGLGKTVQTIALLLYKRKEGASLVVAPTSVVTNWTNEIERFAPSLNITLLNNASIDERSKIVKRAKAGDVVLTTYGILSSEQQPLTDKDWNVVCLDEAHTIKNRDTKMAHSAYQLKAKTRIALTGTPLQNHLGELWSLFNFINPGMLGSFDTFSQKFITMIENGSKERQQQLRRIIMPFVLRRTKSEVVDELPDKTESVRYVELTDEEMSVYELMRNKAKEQLDEEGSVSVSVLAEITKLRQAACAASLAKPEINLSSSKIEQLRDLVGEILEGGNRILIFSQFTSFLKMVRDAFDHDGIEYLYLDGATPMKKRTNLVKSFQEGDKDIFIVSLKAGGLGLNLTSANYVIHLDPWWNPAIEQQATDRAYRIGQKQNVTVYHLISQHTIEEKILRLHKTKRDMADSLLEGTSTSHKISLDELRELLM